MLPTILSTRTLTALGDQDGAITEARATGISDDGMGICGTGINPRPNVEAWVDNDGDEFADCDDTDFATAVNCAPE